MSPPARERHRKKSAETRRSRAARRVVATLALVATASSRALAAPGDPAALGWVRAPGAESCVGAVDLAKAVEKRLGRAALAPLAGAKVSIEGRIAKAPDASGYSVSLTVADATGKVLGTRSLSRETTDCRAMDDDIVLTVALLVDPEAPLSAPPTTAALQTAALQAPPVPLPTSSPSPAQSNTASPVAPPGACPSAIPAASGPPDKPSSPAQRWSAAFFAGPAASLGALPNVGVGAQLRALIAPVPWFALQLGGSVWAPDSATAGGSGGRFFMAIATMEACPLAGRLQSVGYAACAGVEVGSVHVGGIGFPLTYERDDPLVGAVLEARVIRRLIGPFAASLGAGLRAPFVRKQYYSVDAAGQQREVFLSSPIAGTLDLSIGVDL